MRLRRSNLRRRSSASRSRAPYGQRKVFSHGYVLADLTGARMAAAEDAEYTQEAISIAQVVPNKATRAEVEDWASRLLQEHKKTADER
jgi:hypothetical protein